MLPPYLARLNRTGWLSISILVLVFGSCGPQKPAETTPDLAKAAKPDSAPPEENAVQTIPFTSDLDTLPQIPPDDAEEGEAPAPADEGSLTSDPEKPADPQFLLDSALDHCRTAQTNWRSGNLEEALLDLDTAYGLILRVDSEQNPDFFQEKEDLRYLISKRIVEIHASRRTVVGDTDKSIPIIVNKHVEKEIRSFQTRERKFFIQAFARSGYYRPMILEALRKEGLPEQLSWLPLIESGFKTRALSRARALGLWQFISSTGYRYDLNRDQWVDERMDPEKATKAAIRYLVDLHSLFGDWMTALAAYNCGEGRVLRAIKTQRINYLDDFWDLYEKLPRETARYVPRFLATMLILEDPDKYGMELPKPPSPPATESITVQRSVRLSDIDRLANLAKGTLKNLNPELRHGVTPDKAYALRIPIASTETVAGGIKSLPRWEIPRDSHVIHVVRRGETLSTIAQRYRTNTRAIVAANRLANRNRIWPGQKLRVPGTRSSSRRRSSPASPSKALTHKVRRGDSLWTIAKKYGATVDRLREWNKLTGNLLRSGQLLYVRSPEEALPATADNQKTYRVRRGDTLGLIAKRHGVSLSALLRANNLRRRDKIYPSQTLLLPN